MAPTAAADQIRNSRRRIDDICLAPLLACSRRVSRAVGGTVQHRPRDQRYGYRSERQQAIVERAQREASCPAALEPPPQSPDAVPPGEIHARGSGKQTVLDRFGL